jgi:glycosyltransferase involved in cell wall biosynthesis
MKILHVTPSYEPAWHLGGVVKAISQLCRGLAHLGLKVTVFTTDSGQDRRLPVPLNRPVEVAGVRVYYFKTDLSLKYAYSRSLRKACRTSLKDFDIVHAASFWCYPQVAAINAALRHQAPYLLSVHGTLRPDALRQKALKKWLYFTMIEKRHIRKAAALHYTTSMERGLDAGHRFSPPSFIIPNGLDLDAGEKQIRREDARQQWGLEADAPVITFLGRLAPVKALDLLLKAVSTPAVQAQAPVVVLAGPDAGAAASLRHLAKDLGIAARVRFLGEINPHQRDSLFAASDLLSLVSTHENFGYAAVEAMLAGLPVLVSEQVGISREVLADGAGLVVPLEVEAIARALAQLLADRDQLKARGQAAAVAARRRYDFRSVAEKMAQAYDDILTGRRSSGLFWSDQ